MIFAYYAVIHIRADIRDVIRTDIRVPYTNREANNVANISPYCLHLLNSSLFICCYVSQDAHSVQVLQLLVTQPHEDIICNCCLPHFYVVVM